MKRKRFLSVFLSLCMAVMCMAGLSVSACADETAVEKYTLYFDFNGGGSAEYYVEYGEKLADYIPEIAQEGAVFIGWDKEIPETMPAKDLTFTAQWMEGLTEPVIIWSMPTGLGVDGIAGQEYTIAEKGSTPDWSSAQKAESDDYSINFYDLTPATWYTIYTRIAATDTTPAGEAVSIDKLTSLEGLSHTGQTLIGSAVTVIPYPKDVEGLTYQWYRATITPVDPDYPDGAFTTDEEKIEGATGVTYTLTEAELDKYYLVKIYKDGVEVMDSSEHGPVEYGTVIFDSKGGSAVESVKGLKYHDKVTKPADPTLTGYTFAGWYYESEEGDELWDFDKNVIEWNETELFAKWEVTPAPTPAPVTAHEPVYAPISSAAPAAEPTSGSVSAPAQETAAVPAGTLEDVTAESENAEEADISSTGSELADAILDDSDRAAMAKGEDVKVYLEVEEVEPTAEEEALIEEAAEDIGDDITIAAYLDLNLFKQVGGSSAVQVHETNGQIEVSIDLPEGLENTDPTVERSYYIARIHDGEVEIIPAAYDPETGKISFLTDRFSIYAIIFVDVALEEGGELSAGEDEAPNLSDSIVYVTVESQNVTVRLHGGLVPSDAYHIIFFTYEKIVGGESLTRVGTEFPIAPGTYIAAIVANEGSGFFGENRSDPFTIEATEAAEETNPRTGTELPGHAVLAISAAVLSFAAKRKLK